MYVAVFVWNSSGNLEGHGDDWKMLREKTLSLAKFDLEWWTAPLKPILDEFVRASLTLQKEASTVKTEACCAHTNSVRSTLTARRWHETRGMFFLGSEQHLHMQENLESTTTSAL